MPRASHALWSTIPALVSATAVALPFTLVTGCAEKAVEHTVKKIPTETAPDQKPAVTSQGQTEPFGNVRAEVERELRASLDKLDAEIQKLEAKADTLKADARTKLDKAMAQLAAKQKAARQKLDELENASAETWEGLEHGAKAAWEELERAVKEAMKEPTDERAAADQPRRL